MIWVIGDADSEVCRQAKNLAEMVTFQDVGNWDRTY